MTYQTTTRVNRSPTATSPSRGWLTAVLRPAGTLDNLSTAALRALLADLSAAADMVVVDLDATRIPDLAASSMQPSHVSRSAILRSRSAVTIPRRSSPVLSCRCRPIARSVVWGRPHEDAAC
jgi:hypothetical protein